MRYKIKGYQLVYSNGNRDKITLEKPIFTDDKEFERARIKALHTGNGLVCRGVNLDYDELNSDSV